LKYLRFGDGVVLILFLILAAGSFWFGRFVRASEKAAAGLTAVVTVGHRQVMSVNLMKPADFIITGALGQITLRVSNAGIRVLRSACPNQVCVKQGAAQRPGDMLVCVPNHVIVSIRSEATKIVPPSSDKTPVENRGDAVTY
jgi:hypothetical protein